MSTRMPRTVLATVLLALPVSRLALPAAQAQTVDRYERQARVATNNQRVEHDLRRLRKRRCVQRYARRQARRMAGRERLFHQDLGVVLNQCDLRAAAENVAYGYSTGRRVVRAWMQSPGHRLNLLNPAYRQLGMAARKDDDGQWYAVQVFGRG